MLKSSERAMEGKQAPSIPSKYEVAQKAIVAAVSQLKDAQEQRGHEARQANRQHSKQWWADLLEKWPSLPSPNYKMLKD